MFSIWRNPILKYKVPVPHPWIGEGTTADNLISFLIELDLPDQFQAKIFQISLEAGLSEVHYILCFHTPFRYFQNTPWGKRSSHVNFRQDLPISLEVEWILSQFFPWSFGILLSSPLLWNLLLSGKIISSGSILNKNVQSTSTLYITHTYVCASEWKGERKQKNKD